jgi:trimeric autotransporter adhesin
MKIFIRSKQTVSCLRDSAFLILLVMICIAFSQKAQGVIPAPDGGYPGGNTAEGQSALLSLSTGGFNTAVGYFSLRSNTTSSFNTALGAGTLLANTGDQDTATGAGALLSNTTGSVNTANGAFALFSNTTGDHNTADGYDALFSNTTGIQNTANGAVALARNTTGSNNIALGDGAGLDVFTADSVICIGNAGADVSNSCFIGNIYGTNEGGTISAVYINSNGQLGTQAPPSARRFKKEIKSMEQTSEAVFSLNPVTFHYKSDTKGTPQFGLIAEEVAKVNQDLVVRDDKGEIYTVRYDAVNAMLLNEFLKEHRKVEEQEATIAQLSLAVAYQQ